MEQHKRIEQRRYDEEAAPFLGGDVPRAFGAASAPPEFRPPYTEFERQVVSHARPGAVVLDVGAGTGLFSLTARGGGRTLIAMDLSPVALLVARRRAMAANVPLHLVCADAERLPFRDGSIDVVTSAGALYCLDLRVVGDEVRRVLRATGVWVIVDSLNESPVYRFNRWLGFLRKRRTALAVHNVPTIASLRELRRWFDSVRISYHGVLTFLVPILKPLVGAVRAGALVDAADRWTGWFRRWAFKVVVVAEGAGHSPDAPRTAR